MTHHVAAARRGIVQMSSKLQPGQTNWPAITLPRKMPLFGDAGKRAEVSRATLVKISMHESDGGILYGAQTTDGFCTGLSPDDAIYNVMAAAGRTG